MKKVLGVCITVVAVFALLSVSIAAIPVYESETNFSLGLLELDPVTEQLIDNDVTSTLESNETLAVDNQAAQEGSAPIIVSASSNNAVALGEVETKSLNGATIKQITTGDEIAIVGYEGSPTELIVPSMPSGQPQYTTIAEGAFRNCTSLTSITIGETVTKIEYAAFYGCTNLENVTINASVNYIGGYAFIGTKWLSAERGKNIQKLVSVNNILIDGIAAKDEVVIPDTITALSPYAFSYNAAMTSLTMTSITTIPFRAVANCKLLETVSIAGVKDIEFAAFTNSKKLTTVADATSLEHIKAMAFDKCYALTTITLPETNFKTIGKNAFMDCTSLVEITFPSSMTDIDDAAFLQCSSLKTIIFNEPASQKTVNIGQGAFMDCVKLEFVTLEPTKTALNIKTGAFTNTKYASI